MTKHSSFKRLVRSRMAKTGESYTTARRQVLAAADAGPGEPSDAAERPLTTSDDEIRRRSGRGWEEWFDWLDDRRGPDRSHREIARLVADELAIDPLVWEAQAVTLSYERARGMRVVGQRSDGSFAATASKTIAAPATEVFSQFADEQRRSAWLRDDRLTLRTATEPRTLRFDWEDGTTRVNVSIDAKAEAKTTVVLEHGRLADDAAAATMKSRWRDALAALKSLTEGGEGDG